MKVWLLWQYDDGIVPEKELMGVYSSRKSAKKEKKALEQELSADYEYEIEPTEVKE